MSRLKIFQVTDVDWWAGYDAQSVREAYREQVGPEADDLLAEFGEAYELSPEAAEKFIVTDVDEPRQPKHTGAEILVGLKEIGAKVPCFIASSEY